jgi:signal transduction histidine kinase
VAYRLEGSTDGPAERQSLTVMAHRGISPELARRVDPLPLRGSYIEKAAAAEQPMVWQVAHYPTADLKRALEQEGVQVGISVPLLAKGTLVGAMVLGAYHLRPFAPEELSLLAVVGQQISVAIENAHLYKSEQERRVEAERRRQVAEGMREIVAVLNSRQSLSATLDFIVTQACRVLGSDAASLSRLEGPEGVPKIESACGLDADYTAGLRIPIAVGAAGRALAERRPIAIPDAVAAAASMMEESDLPPEAERGRLLNLIQRYRALLSVPLVVQDDNYGAITLYYRQAREFSEEEVRLALSVAHQAALAIESARLREQAEQSAAIAERTRLARELHDSVTQSLYSITLYAEAAARLLADGKQGAAADHLRELRETAQESLREMRLLIFELRPLALEKSGLAAALQSRLEAVEVRGGMQTEFQAVGVERLSAPTQDELYHIAQEALNNVLKHAKAPRVRVCLQFLEAVTRLEVCDNGIGFDPVTVRERGGLGLAGIQERVQRIGGSLQVDSAPGKGTRVTVQVPVCPLEEP